MPTVCRSLRNFLAKKIFASSGCLGQLLLWENYCGTLNYTSSFTDLVIILNQKAIHQRCLKFLMTNIQIFKFTITSVTHTLRSFNQFETYILKIKLSLNSNEYRANQLWQLLLHNIKNCYYYNSNLRFESWFAMNVHVISVNNVLRILFTLIKIGFSN